ncbi:MAG: 4-hydroxy-3-methylbut-2-enyl diphosphate reductase, partial [Succinivibrio sp.]
MLQIKIARSRGMCAGVERAIATVHEALTKYQNGRVYVLHEVVHNRHVVEDLKVAGAHFVDSLDEVPSDAVLIISAHGVGHETIDEINRLGIRYIDATCPVVSAIHRKVNKAGLQGLDVIVIGHRGHREVIGTVGQYTGDSSKIHVIINPEDVKLLDLDGDNVFFTTQTTLSVDETAKTVHAL